MYISKDIKRQVWNKYIGEEVNKTLCPLCETNYICAFEFDCAHVLADCHGGDLSIANLRPLCGWCNSCMGSQHMLDYAKTHYPQSPLIDTLTNPPNLLAKPERREVVKLTCEQIGNKCACHICYKLFAEKSSLTRHINNKVCTKEKLTPK